MIAAYSISAEMIYCHAVRYLSYEIFITENVSALDDASAISGDV